MDQITSFGEWLRRRRKALDLTQAELADQAGCVTGTIRSIEADARRPSKQLAERLAEVLQLAQDERAQFMRAARAELSPDQLAPPARVRDPAPPVVAEPSPERALQTGLPSGTVTFLMSDIEASTQLWEQHPQAMQIALPRHDTLLREAISAAGGAVVKSTGDGVLAVFRYAVDALAAALNAQRALMREAWDTPTPLRVRMALHTGEAKERAGDYFGTPLNRLARVLAAGQGGQVLVSRASWELLADHLPPDLELRDLGAHRLKDLSRPEQIFQLVASDLPHDFPPLRTLDAHRTNLSTPPTPLLGREQLLAQLATLLRRRETRLVTLTGPGGTGKTRLAIQLAAELLDVFLDGAWFVDLAPIRDPDMVISTIAQTLDLKEQGGETPIEQLKAYLRDKQMLIVLDNFEQVVEAAPHVAEVLGAAPQLKVLSTSRMILKLRGEQEIDVPRLDLPDLEQLPALEALSQYAAVALFVERARAVKHDFAVTNENAPAVAEICYRLDGLPLALELAAARIKLFSPEALLRRLERRLPLLTGGARDLPARQQTMRHTIAWSYDLLSKVEQLLFQRLGVFVGGCTLEAAEAICNRGGDLEIELLDGLVALVEKSLLRQTEGSDDESRFTMLETIREYALEQWVERGQADDLRQRHAAYFLELAEQAEPWLDNMRPEHDAWIAQLEPEYDNLRTALEWFSAREEAESVLRLAAALMLFWAQRFHWREGRAWLESALRKKGNIPVAVRARALVAAAYLIHSLGDIAAACAYLQEGLALLQRLDNKPGIALALRMLGNAMLDTGNYVTAHTHAVASLVVCQEIGDAWGTLRVLQLLGHIATAQGDFAQGELYTEDLLRSYRELGSKKGIGGSLIDRGVIAQLQGDWERAVSLYAESLAIARELGDKWLASLNLHNLGGALLHQGYMQRAAMCFIEGLTLSRAIGFKYGISMNLAGIAGLMAAQAQPMRSARLFGAADASFDAIGMAIEFVDRIEYGRNREIARAQLGEEAFATAWAEGRAMTLEQAVAEALEASNDTLRDDG